METKLNTTTRIALLAALLCSSPLLAFAKERKEKKEHEDKHARFSKSEQAGRLESRSQLPSGRRTVSKEYIHQRLDWMRVKDPRHFRTFAYFDTLIAAGYSPLLLDAWLDGLYDGVVVVGMPSELVLDYYGDPVFRKAVVFNGAPAFEWGVQLLPGRVGKVTVVGNKVVRVHG